MSLIPTDEPKYLLYVHLANSDRPRINRLLPLQPDHTLDKLHSVLQTSLGWANRHSYSFNVISTEGPMYRDRQLLSSLNNTSVADLYPGPEKVKGSSDFTLAQVFDGEK